MAHALHLDEALDLARRGQVLLLPSPAAATSLRGQFDRQQRVRGLRAWQAPEIRAWSEWLESLWQSLAADGLESRVLLNPLQEERLWAATLKEATSPSAAPSTAHGLARQARSALTRAAEYNAVNRLAAGADTADARTFLTWHKAFAARCRAERLLPRALLADALISHLEAGRLAAPPSLHLVSLDPLTPQTNALLKALEAAGSILHTHALHHAESTPLRGCGLVAGDSDVELRWALRRIRKHCSEAPASPPGNAHPAQIALVLPDPEAERVLLQAQLRQWLAPELEPVTADLSSRPWHCSAGPPLAEFPILAHAMLLLRWLGSELSTEAIGILLLSPYLLHTDAFEGRARFELLALRGGDLLRPELTLDTLLHLAAAPPSPGRSREPSLALPEWQDVQQLVRKGVRLTGSATFGEWGERVRRILRTAGWPGSRPLSPSEFRATEAWESVLDLLATLDLLGTPAPWPEMLELLATELRKPTRDDPGQHAPVQILRLSETEGRLFDAVLLLRSTDKALPQPETLHPLLGRSLQRSLGMPGADPATTHNRSRAAIESLLARTGNFLLTAAAQDADGPQRLTELARELDLPPLNESELLPPADEASPVPTTSEPDLDLLPSLPSPHVPGGARVLELQANCGFQAFASLRLGASAPEVRSLGADPRQLGNDLHKVLEIFWSAVPGRKELAALSPSARQTAVTAAVTEVLRPRHTHPAVSHAWTPAYLEIAGQRLTQLVLRWLDQELARGDFRVLSQEKKNLIPIGPLELSVRPDRMDAVEGGLVVVDYKTSFQLSTADWSGDRPKAPQLPLYALTQPDQVRALAFGRVRPGRDMTWISLGSEAGTFPKGEVHPGGLAELVVAWRAELTRLATEFADGVASINPKSYPGSCQYCGQRLLCRLDPATLLAGEETPENSEEEAGPER